MVRLIEKPSKDDLMKLSNFNSTMVRLIVSLTPEQIKGLPVFQFHYGAINSMDYNPRRKFWVHKFQFHYGAINSQSLKQTLLN